MKKITLVALLGPAALGLAACSQPAEDTPMTDETPTDVATPEGEATDSMDATTDATEDTGDRGATDATVEDRGNPIDHAPE